MKIFSFHKLQGKGISKSFQDPTCFSRFLKAKFFFCCSTQTPTSNVLAHIFKAFYLVFDKTMDTYDYTYEIHLFLEGLLHPVKKCSALMKSYFHDVVSFQNHQNHSLHFLIAN